MAVCMDFIKNNIFLIAVAFVSGAMLIFPLVRSRASGPSVGTTEATQLINREDALLIDVRDAEEYAKGHILGARNIPLAQLESRIGELEKHKEKPVIVSCDSGGRSAGALSTLRGKGFARAVNLAGGLNAWKQAGLPVEK
jgi:rhodanese-related sulfurtransferase